MGRHKIPIKAIDKPCVREVCFSKRRKGLFSKAKKLASVGSELAIIVFSRVGNVFSFSHPSIESVVNRFLSPENNRNRSSDDDKSHGNADIVAWGSDAASGSGPTRPSIEGESSTKGDKLDGGDTIMQDKVLELDHEEDELESETSRDSKGPDIAGSLQEEHAAMHDGHQEKVCDDDDDDDDEDDEDEEKMIVETATGGESNATEEETLHSGRFWWNKRIDDLELRELVEFESALQKLREKVRDRTNQILVEKPVMGYNFDFSKYKFRFPE